MNKILIEDFNLVKTDVIKSINITLVDILLKKKATFKVTYHDEYNSCCKIDYIDIEGNDYLQWYNDDEYIINYILNRLNLNKKNDN